MKRSEFLQRAAALGFAVSTLDLSQTAAVLAPVEQVTPVAAYPHVYSSWQTLLKENYLPEVTRQLARPTVLLREGR